MANDNKMIMILLLVMFCCCASSLATGLTWWSNILCDKTNPESQIIGMDCPSVYKPPASTPDTTPSTSSTPPSTSPAPGPATNPCATYTNTSLAKDVTQKCLQKIWKDSGCTTDGTVYPSDTYQGWWNSSPGGLGTKVYCSGNQVSGNSAGDCGAGNYGTIVSDMALWGSLTDATHKMGCLGHT